MAFDHTGLPTQWDYDGDQGDTIRFGFEGFGQPPNDGDVFDVTYRIGLGATGNVAAEAIHNVDPTATAYLAAVRNPFLVTNGADEETAQHVQRMAPQAFRADQFRAVRPEDYVAAAETLPWVLERRNRVPLDGKLAHRLYHRRPQRQRARHRDEPDRSDRPAQSPPARGL